LIGKTTLFSVVFLCQYFGYEVAFDACGMERMRGLLQPSGIAGLFFACGMGRMRGLNSAL